MRVPLPVDGRLLIGVVHLPPLPGSPRWSQLARAEVQALLDATRRDAEGFAQAGFDALIVENYGDVPFFKRVPPETVAVMTRLACAAREASGLPLGVNVLRNDARAALGCALAAEAGFVRVNVHCGVAAADQGLLEGQAAETLRLREALGVGPTSAAPIGIWADVHVKHARTIDQPDLAQAAADAVDRGLADAVIVSGVATGSAPTSEALARVHEAVEVPLLIGSGLTVENAALLAPHCRGAIAASAAREGGKAGRPLDPARARALVAAFRDA
ncbi:MAG: BtpA/SgcQ family protein [Planctomycetes bacterium]|nr:BtpA/SgcQ family protein [Planctomycetota bacterium]